MVRLVLKNMPNEIYHDSFERCLAIPGFFNRFYELFLDSSPAIQEKFKNTDFRKQIQMVKKSLYRLTMATTQSKESLAELGRVKKTHSRDQLNIEPYMYDLWLDSLLQTVKEYDKAWTPEVETSWRRVFEPYIEILKH
jgi:hemoglobin-like flavoprotein